VANSTVETKRGEVQSFNAEIPPARVSHHLGWALWPLWVAACALGNALAAIAFSSVGKIIDAPTAPQFIKMAAQPAAFLVVLTLPAFLQWLILRHWFRPAGWWIPASGAGWFLGLMLLGWGIAVADTQGESAFARIAVPAGFLLPGAVAGAVQWLVLRRGVSHAGWWVLASSIGWVAGMWTFMSLAGTGQGRYFEGGVMSQAIAGAASGALSGAVSGLALVWLMRYTKVNQSSGSAVAGRA
jgi:hypothetical protein